MLWMFSGPNSKSQPCLKLLRSSEFDAKSNQDILKCCQDKIILRAKLCPLLVTQVQMSDLANPFQTLCVLIFQIFSLLGMEDFANAGETHTIAG